MVTRAYVQAVFDQHLRGEPQALLGQPSLRFPELMFRDEAGPVTGTDGSLS